MDAKILTQPFDSQGDNLAVGDKLFELLDSRTPLFDRVWLVSAFVNQKAMIRLSPHIAASRRAGANIHFVVGIDHHSTTIEALREILTLNTDAKIVNNPRPGHTFHPKIYLFEATGQRAELLLGSSNLTEGGIFTNYEVVAWFSFDLTGQDVVIFQSIRSSLDRFLNPTGPTAQPLTEELIQVLIDRGDIVSEVMRRRARRQATNIARRVGQATTIPPSPFGVETVPPPPPLPTEPVRRISRPLERRRREVPALEPAPSYDVTAFYMHLNKLQGPTIPGEVRIPIVIRRIDEAFWGWDDEYQIEYRSRGERIREYRTWKPVWRIVDTDAPEQVYQEEVRIYGYEDRAEYRFYSRRLVLMGADEFDIVRITRCEPGEEATFQCELARRGSPTHALWEEYCTQPVTNSRRRFGFV
jgi:hypothetical protein